MVVMEVLVSHLLIAGFSSNIGQVSLYEPARVQENNEERVGYIIERKHLTAKKRESQKSGLHFGTDEHAAGSNTIILSHRQTSQNSLQNTGMVS